MINRIRVRAIAGHEVLAGAARGASVLAKLLPYARPSSGPTVIALDFGGISVATGSFLRECVLGFRAFCRRGVGDIYPVVANANETVLEELRELLHQLRQSLVCCQIGDGGKVRSAWVEGVLDVKQALTLDAVLETGEEDASSLARRFGATERVLPTAWNNRLSQLAGDGILIELRAGRAKRYRPVLEGLRRGR